MAANELLEDEQQHSDLKRQEELTPASAAGKSWEVCKNSEQKGHAPTTFLNPEIC